MAEGWRGFVQRLLRGAADRFEKHPIKKWTAVGQKIGIATAIATLITIFVCVAMFGVIATGQLQSPPCDNPSCYQAMWQGNWAMWSVILSGVTLVATSLSIWGLWISLGANRDVQKLEFRAYIDANFLKRCDAIRYDIFFTLEYRNYGRTPASDIVGQCWFSIYPFDTDDKNEIYSAEAYFDLRDIHPSMETQKTVFKFKLDPNIYEKIRHRKFEASVELMMEYKDVFGSSYELKPKEWFHVYEGRASNTLELVAI